MESLYPIMSKYYHLFEKAYTHTYKSIKTTATRPNSLQLNSASASF